jgi:ribosomal protein L17
MTASFPVKKLLATFSPDTTNRVVQETSLLSKSGSDHRAFVHADVTMEAVATPWAPAARRNTVAAVLNLASVHTYRRRLGRNASVMEKLVQLARADPASTRKDVLPALLSLANERENVGRLVDAGVAPPARAAAHPREPLHLCR